MSVLTQGRCHISAWKFYARRLSEENIAASRVQGREEAVAFSREHRPNVVHVHSSDLISLGLSIAREFQAPVIFTSHGLGVLP